MHSVEAIISDGEMEKAFGYANFGSTPKREVLRNTLLKCVAGYKTGHTAQAIVQELGLVYSSKWALTKRGAKYLFAAYSNGLSV